MFSYNSRYSEPYFLIMHKNSSSSSQLNGNTDWWQNWHIQMEILSSIVRCSSGTNVKHFMWYFPLQKLQHICLEWLKNLEWHMLQHIMLTTYGVIYNTLIVFAIHSTIQLHYWLRFDIVSARCKSGIEIWNRNKMNNIQTKIKKNQLIEVK